MGYRIINNNSNSLVNLKLPTPRKLLSKRSRFWEHIRNALEVGVPFQQNQEKASRFSGCWKPIKGRIFIGNYIYCSPYNSRGMSWTIGFFWKLDYIQQESCYNYSMDGIFLQHLPQFCFVELLCFCYAYAVEKTRGNNLIIMQIAFLHIFP